jgi:hypothetical protein
MSDQHQTTADILGALRDPRHFGHLNAAAADEIERARAAISSLTLRVNALRGVFPEPDTAHVGCRWRHKKRGTVYTEVCMAELQAATRQPEEGELMIVYRGEDGNVWVRAAGEFRDGRFEEINDAAG